MNGDRLAWTIYESPLGPLTVVAGPGGVRNVHFSGRSPRVRGSAQRPLPAVTDQLDGYFAGEREAFDLCPAEIDADAHDCLYGR